MGRDEASFELGSPVARRVWPTGGRGSVAVPNSRRGAAASLSQSQGAVSVNIPETTFAQADHRPVTLLRSRQSLEWDSPTPMSRTNKDLSLLLSSAESMPSPEFPSIRSFNPHQLSPPLSLAPNPHFAKSWAGRPSTYDMVPFAPLSTSTPPRHSRKRLPLFPFDENDTSAPRYASGDTAISDTGFSRSQTLQSSVSGHHDWMAQGVSFKRFPGSSVSSRVNVPVIDEHPDRMGVKHSTSNPIPHRISRPAVPSVDWERMKEDSLALRRGRQVEILSRSPKHRSHSVNTEQPIRVPLRDFIAGKKFSQRPSLSRIPRLSSLQELRPTPTVIAAAEALVPRELDNNSRELSSSPSDSHSSLNANAANPRIKRLTSLPSLIGARNPSYPPVPSSNDFVTASHLRQHLPDPIPKLSHSDIDWAAEQIQAQNARQRNSGIPESRHRASKSLRSSVSMSSLAANMLSRRLNSDLEWCLQKAPAPSERPPSSCLSMVGSESDEESEAHA